MRFTSPSRTIPSICLAIYGCGQLDRVADFINNSGEYVEDGVTFTPGMIAGQYAFEQVKLDRKGYDTRRLQKYLSFLADAGAYFSEEEALQRADDLINNFTADFGHDEDGDATFRIKAQSYRLKKCSCGRQKSKEDCCFCMENPLRKKGKRLYCKRVFGLRIIWV